MHVICSGRWSVNRTVIMKGCSQWELRNKHAYYSTSTLRGTAEISWRVQGYSQFFMKSKEAAIMV